jgi:hypothetical protein
VKTRSRYTLLPVFRGADKSRGKRWSTSSIAINFTCFQERPWLRGWDRTSGRVRCLLVGFSDAAKLLLLSLPLTEQGILSTIGQSFRISQCLSNSVSDDLLRSFSPFRGQSLIHSLPRNRTSYRSNLVPCSCVIQRISAYLRNITRYYSSLQRTWSRRKV